MLVNAVPILPSYKEAVKLFGGRKIQNGGQAFTYPVRPGPHSLFSRMHYLQDGDALDVIHYLSLSLWSEEKSHLQATKSFPYILL